MLQEEIRSTLATPGLKAVIMETYGSGNAPTVTPLLKHLAGAIEGGLLVLNVRAGAPACSTL